MKLALNGFGRATTTGHLFLYADSAYGQRAMQVKNVSLSELVYGIADLFGSQALNIEYGKREHIQLSLPWATDEAVDFIMTGALPDDDHPTLYQATVGTDEEPDPGPPGTWEEQQEAELEAKQATGFDYHRPIID